MIKVSDYIIDFLVSKGVKHAFLLPGGQSMHMVNSIRSNQHIEPVTVLHEQAASMMTEAYSRVTNNYGACIVSTGPGGTNCITGLIGAWLDSTPCMFLSGQFGTSNLVYDQGIRQTGLQNTDPVAIVESITKYSQLVLDPKTIKYHLEKAYHLSTTGRPGPVWLDIPIDVAGAMVDINTLEGYTPEVLETADEIEVKGQVANYLELLTKAKRPVILAGNGVRLSKANSEFLDAVKKLGIPVLTTINGLDLIAEDNQYFLGRPNYWGQRYANFAIQNTDLLLSVGAGLHIETTGFNYKAFAREAIKVSVDIDKNELNKKDIPIDHKIHCDAKRFFIELNDQLEQVDLPKFEEWWKICKEWKAKYPIITDDIKQLEDRVHPFMFYDALCDELDADCNILHGSAGTHFVAGVQAFKVKQGQRAWSEIGIGAMGHSLPGSIAAYFARPTQTVCISGDGGFQFNMQELQTIVNYNLPIKIFVCNNNGYASIKNTQKAFFDSNFVGTFTEGSGQTLPDITKIVKAYGIKTCKIKHQKNLNRDLRKVLDYPGPIVCEVMLPVDGRLEPKITAKLLKDGSMVANPLEDLWPFLDREEFQQNMLIGLWEES
jgi:acetolactate synthase-1/2/3 large subunit